MSCRRLALVAGAVVLAGGCGGDDEAAPRTQNTIGGAEHTPHVTDKGDAKAGKTVFSQAGCGGCHVLSEAGSKGTAGPNLDEAELDLAEVVEQVRSGGGGMPAFNGRLSEKEIVDVSAFVAQSSSD